MKKLLVVILAALLSLPSFAQELTPKRNARGKWGYVDTKDNWLIKAKYDVAEEFTPDGFAKVKNSKGKWGYVNKVGEEVVRLRYDWLGDFSIDGLCMVQDDNKYGLVDRNG